MAAWGGTYTLPEQQIPGSPWYLERALKRGLCSTGVEVESWLFTGDFWWEGWEPEAKVRGEGKQVSVWCEPDFEEIGCYTAMQAKLDVLMMGCGWEKVLFDKYRMGVFL